MCSTAPREPPSASPRLTGSRSEASPSRKLCTSLSRMSARSAISCSTTSCPKCRHLARHRNRGHGTLPQHLAFAEAGHAETTSLTELVLTVFHRVQARCQTLCSTCRDSRFTALRGYGLQRHLTRRTARVVPSPCGDGIVRLTRAQGYGHRPIVDGEDSRKLEPRRPQSGLTMAVGGIMSPAEQWSCG